MEKTLQKFFPPDKTEFIWEKYLKQINDCFSGATVEEIVANLERDNTDWSASTLKVQIYILRVIFV